MAATHSDARTQGSGTGFGQTPQHGTTIHGCPALLTLVQHDRVYAQRAHRSARTPGGAARPEARRGRRRPGRALGGLHARA